MRGFFIRVFLVFTVIILPGISDRSVALARKDLPILIISSYNPDTYTTSQNIQSIQNACDSLGITNPIVVENMNCKNFSESILWKRRFKELLNKHLNKDEDLSVAAIILLGQEAWASYLSQDKELVGKVPVVGGMISGNSLTLPDSTVALKDWMPNALYLTKGDVRNNVLVGIAYDYNIHENIRMARKFYPDFKNIAFLSDNTFGGVVLQAHVRSELEKYKDINLILLDGRSNDIYEIQNKIAALPDSTVLFIGTWRVDKNESYFISSAANSLMLANEKVPAFSLTTIGLGSWAVGGCVPDYRNQGVQIAQQLYGVLKSRNKEPGVYFEYIPNIKKYDAHVIADRGLNFDLTKNGILINKEKTLTEKYPYLIYIILIVLFILGIIFFILAYFLYKTNKLNTSLITSEENNKLILNNISVGLMFISSDYTVMWENFSVVEGMEPFRTFKRGHKCYTGWCGTDDVCGDCPIKNKNRKHQQIERIERKGHRVFSFLYTTILDGENRFLGTVVRIEDITEREKTNMALQEAKIAAENSDKLKSQFLANMSHEIRTPLNAIVGFSALLADIDDPDDKKEFLKIIESNNRQLLQLINDILDLSKIEAGTLEFHTELANLSEIIEEVYQVFAPQGDVKGILIVKEVPREEFNFMSDRNRIAQVITNFMTNALKFTQKGSITLGYEIREKDVKIYVRDTGCGISEDKRRSVFERFVKLNSFAQGTGLGLSICMMIVNRLGGEIDVDSKEGEGSTFWFTVPRIDGGGGKSLKNNNLEEKLFR